MDQDGSSSDMLATNMGHLREIKEEYLQGKWRNQMSMRTECFLPAPNDLHISISIEHNKNELKGASKGEMKK